MSDARAGRIALYDTTLSIWEEPPAVSQQYESEFRDVVLMPLLARLRDRRWVVTLDPEGKRYPSIARDMWCAALGDLQVSIRLMGRSIEILFFQDVNRQHSVSGRYDFGRFHKLPYAMRLRFLAEMKATIAHLRQRHGYDGPTLAQNGASEHARIVLTCAHGNKALVTENALKSFNDHWDSEFDLARGHHRFRRDETGWPTRSELGAYHPYHEPGAVRYWINPKGYVLRGRVYPNMNGMFAFVFGSGARDCTYRHGSEFAIAAPSLRKIKNHGATVVIKRLLDQCVGSENFEKAKTLRDYRNQIARVVP